MSGDRSTRHRAAGVVLAATLCATTSSCSSAVSLQLPGGSHAAASGLPTPTVGDPLSLGAGTVVCLSAPGIATVVEVRAREASENFAVQGFAVRPNPSLTGDDQLGEVRGSLSEAGFDPSAREVDMACDSADGAGYEVGVQVARTGPGPATSRGFEVRWRSGKETGTVFIPLGVLLCDAPTAFPPRCDANALLHA